jgi:hypothetical protein
VPEGGIQPEAAGLRGPQLLPAALRHPGHPDPRSLVPPGPTLPRPATQVTVLQPPDPDPGGPSRTSSPTSIRFIMTFRRLGRVSRSCRSRYATSAIRSPSNGRRRRPAGGPPAGPGRPCAPRPIVSTSPRQAS